MRRKRNVRSQTQKAGRGDCRAAADFAAASPHDPQRRRQHRFLRCFIPLYGVAPDQSRLSKGSFHGAGISHRRQFCLFPFSFHPGIAGACAGSVIRLIIGRFPSHLCSKKADDKN